MPPTNKLYWFNAMNNLTIRTAFLILIPEVLLSHSEKSPNDIEPKELLPEQSLAVLKRLPVNFSFRSNQRKSTLFQEFEHHFPPLCNMMMNSTFEDC